MPIGIVLATVMAFRGVAHAAFLAISAVPLFFASMYLVNSSLQGLADRNEELAKTEAFVEVGKQMPFAFAPNFKVASVYKESQTIWEVRGAPAMSYDDAEAWYRMNVPKDWIEFVDSGQLGFASKLTGGKQKCIVLYRELATYSVTISTHSVIGTSWSSNIKFVGGRPLDRALANDYLRYPERRKE